MDSSTRGSDERLSRMLRAVGAEADPAAWARARARIESRAGVPALLVWATRPRALAWSGALFTLALVAAVTIARQTPAATASDTSMVSQLLGNEDSGLPGLDSGGGPTAGDSSGALQ